MAAVDIKTAVDVVGRALAEFSLGRAVVPERVPIRVAEHDATSLFMPALAPRLGALGVKVVSVYPRNPQAGKPTITGVYTLLDITSGEPLAIIEGSSLTALRTGAVVGQATLLLARSDADCAAVIGTGVQAREALRAVLAVRRLTEVRLYNRTFAKVKAFVAEVEAWPQSAGVKFVIAAAPEAAMRGAGIVITATTSGTPVFHGSAVAPGMHINAVGSFRPTMQELPTEAVALADKVVVESRHSALIEAGDLLVPIGEGRFRPEQIHAELGEIYAGKRAGRETAAEITLFKSVGHAVMDAAVARVAYERALQCGLGSTVDLGIWPTPIADSGGF